MGQYHFACNKTKKEFLHAHKLELGLKLWEQVGFAGSTADILFALLANSNGRGGGDFDDNDVIGRWAGDEIVVQGDYAEKGDPGYIPEDELKQYKDISHLVIRLQSELRGE